MAGMQVIDPGWSWDEDWPLSQAIRCGDFIFLAGQGPIDGGGKLADGGLASQTRQIFENIKVLLELAGAGFADVVKLTTYFVADIVPHSADRAVYFTVRQQYFGDNKPASTGVEVAALALPGMLLEVDVVAYAPEPRS